MTQERRAARRRARTKTAAVPGRSASRVHGALSAPVLAKCRRPPELPLRLYALYDVREAVAVAELPA
jgi:hypothetical protein